MRAHSKLTESGDVSFYSQSTSEVAQRPLRESSEDSNGEREMTPSPRPYKPTSTSEGGFFGTQIYVPEAENDLDITG
jgi:hypothetical protein